MANISSVMNDGNGAKPPLILEIFGEFYISYGKLMSGKMNAMEAITEWSNIVMTKKHGRLSPNSTLLNFTIHLKPFERVTSMENNGLSYNIISKV